MTACDECLRRAGVLGVLAEGIGRVLEDPDERVPGLLALPDDDLIEAVGGPQRERARAARAAFRASDARSRMEALGIEARCLHSDTYPKRMRDLSDRPAVLFSAGAPGRLDKLVAEPMVSIVGARRCSLYAEEVAENLGRGLSAANVTVVSGLALGVDAAAHRGAVAAGGNAIAVLASGVDVPYPRRHRALYRQIRETGAVISELPPGVPPYRWSFPARNRIMAALGRMVIVVEAAEGSGSLITTTFASDLGREVGVVPGRVTHRIAAGSNRLLYDGATPIRGPRDVLDSIYGAGKGPSTPDAVEQLEPDLRQVLDAVERGEEIGSLSGLPANEVRAALGRLESLGLVRRDGLGSYERTACG